MNVKIRPQWVISLVILVVMFIAARIYVGRAIERETQPQKEVRAHQPHERPSRVEPEAPEPPSEPDQSGLVMGPLSHVSAVVEAGTDEEREAFYASARKDAAAVTEAIATQIPVDQRRRVLDAYDDLLKTEDAAPVKAELSKLRADLERWFGELPAPTEVPEEPEPAAEPHE